MINVEKIHISPVKSLGLIHPDKVYVSEKGIPEDRRFFLLDEDNKLVTQRQIGKLTQILSDYCPNSGKLSLKFPDGSTLEETIVSKGTVKVIMWGRSVIGDILEGSWTHKLSNYCGKPIRIVRTRTPGAIYDEFPVAIMSTSTIKHISNLASRKKVFESARFRPTFVLSGCEAYQEDEWIGHKIRIGDQLHVKIVSRDPRCVITTLNPMTGERDFDMLRLILNDRPNLNAAYLGVYGIVEQAGTVMINDLVSIP